MHFELYFTIQPCKSSPYGLLITSLQNLIKLTVLKKLSSVYVDYHSTAGPAAPVVLVVPVGPVDCLDSGSSFGFADSVRTSAASAGLSVGSSAAFADLVNSSGLIAAESDQSAGSFEQEPDGTAAAD